MENLLKADELARKGKKHKKEVIDHDKNKKHNLLELQNQLKNKSFQTSPYHIFKIYIPKERDIYKLPYYPDRILHHAIMRVLEPIWVKGFTSDTYACIKKRGIHKAVRQIKSDLRDTKETKYCLKFDIRKYYPSIDHDILKAIIRKKIKDNDLLWLLDGIIDSADGIPIGNYLSQYFANIYLSYFDHYIKEVLSIKYYYRYVDDIVILDATKERLWFIFGEAGSYLNNRLNLTVKGNYQIYPVASRGIDFLGYRFYHTHVLLRKTLKKSWIQNVLSNQVNRAHAFWSYYGWAIHCNHRNLLKKILSMKKFLELGINLTNDSFIGDKIKIDKIINKEIIIHDYKITESKFKNKCLTLQIELNSEKKVIFTGAKLLIQGIEQVDKSDLPFACTIVSENQMYQFT